MTNITLNKSELSLQDWQRLRILQTKAAFYRLGVDYYTLLMRTYYPSQYNTRASLKKVINVWHLRAFDEVILDQLNACITNEQNR